jgi:hypothetical protein
MVRLLARTISTGSSQHVDARRQGGCVCAPLPVCLSGDVYTPQQRLNVPNDKGQVLSSHANAGSHEGDSESSRQEDGRRSPEDAVDRLRPLVIGTSGTAERASRFLDPSGSRRGGSHEQPSTLASAPRRGWGLLLTSFLTRRVGAGACVEGHNPSPAAV